MPTLRIKIVAAVDQNLSNIFVPLATAAKRASKQVADSMAAGAAAAAHPYRSLPAKVKPALEETAKGAERVHKASSAAAETAATKFGALSDKLRQTNTLLSEMEKEMNRVERQKARAALGLPTGGVGGGGAQRPIRGGHLGGWIGPRVVARGAPQRLTDYSVSEGTAAFASGGLRIGMGAISGATRLGADLLRGAGVNTDLTSIVGSNVELEKRAQDVSNFGYMNEGPNARRVDPGELTREARKIGAETGNEAGTVMEGLEKFVGLTGDLKTGRAVMKDLAVLSKATGSNVSEMAEAAGAASMAMGNIPNKAETVYDVMKAIGGEGKTGAILIKDMAVQMAKVAASSRMFEGDTSKNIRVLGAIAQEARGVGGAASPAQAATAVQGFVASFVKGPRLEAFKGFGVDVYGKHGGLRDPREIIIDSLRAAMHGGTTTSRAGKATYHPGGPGQNFETNLATMFQDRSARRAIGGYETTFAKAYDESKGATEEERMRDASIAVRAEFERIVGNAMTEETVQKEFALAMNTTASKVSTFNTELGGVAAQIQANLLPALIALGPAVIALAKGISGFVETLTGHDGQMKVEEDLRQKNVELAVNDAVYTAKSGPERDRETGPDGKPIIGPMLPKAFEVPKEMGAQVNQIDQERQQALAAARETLTKTRRSFNRDHPGVSAEEAEATGNFSAIQKLAKGNDFEALAYLRSFDKVQGAERDAKSAALTKEDFENALKSNILRVVVVSAPPATFSTSSNLGQGGGNRMDAESK